MQNFRPKPSSVEFYGSIGTFVASRFWPSSDFTGCPLSTQLLLCRNEYRTSGPVANPSILHSNLKYSLRWTMPWIIRLQLCNENEREKEGLFRLLWGYPHSGYISHLSRNSTFFDSYLKSTEEAFQLKSGSVSGKFHQGQGQGLRSCGVVHDIKKLQECTPEHDNSLQFCCTLSHHPPIKTS